MSLRVTFLGTGGALPTVERAPSAVHVNREGDGLLFDCGEGTQRQMMRHGTGFSLAHVFVTHCHGDHVLGLPGLVGLIGARTDLDEPTSRRVREALAAVEAETTAGESRGREREPPVEPDDREEAASEGPPHAVLGLPGLVQSMGLDERSTGLTIHGPPGTRATLEEIVGLGGHRPSFPVRVREVTPGSVALDGDGYEVRAFRTDHRTRSVGYALVEDERPGRFDRRTAEEELGIPPGPVYGRLHAGETVELDDGRVIEPEQVVGEPRPGRRLVYTGDTRPTEATVDAAHEADLLIHDATFTTEEAGRARETGHSTAREAAGVAERADARRLALVHVSSRYAGDASPLGAEARAAFDGEAFVPDDGDRRELPFPDADG